MNYIPLPKEFAQLTKPIDYVNLLKNKIGHDWIYIPITDFLTDEGINFFASKKFVLNEKITLFKCVRGTVGPIHIDTIVNSNNDYAFNFVLSGNGTMEWLSDIKGKCLISNANNGHYLVYKDVESCNVTESWSGDLALVKINLPHRVVAFDTDRYCVSVRTVPGSFPKTFEDAVNMI